MKIISHFLLILLSVLSARAADDGFFLTGSVKDAVTKTDLPRAKVILYNSNGEPRDSLSTSQKRYTRIALGEGTYREVSEFYIGLEDRRDSTYVFDVECPGYITKTVSYRVEKVGKREQYRNIPTIYLERAPYKLDEVTVTSSKIKFYNKGDTIVYNADAFQLAEGSMLDALIAVLPGVQLKDNGAIYVNGEYVESLLLNGKQFLDGNNQLMLDNISAYTVKNIEVYQGQTEREKWENDPTAPRHLTMDVKMKKEYQNSWIVNAQGGAGTEDRYTGRLFSALITPHKTVSLIGNLNNLNDNRKPGKNDTWTPEMMPSGTKIYKTGAITYNLENNDRTRELTGHVMFEQTTNNNRTTRSSTNFLSGGDTYENGFSRSHNSNTKIELRDYLRCQNEKYFWGGMIVARHERRDNDGQAINGSFTEEQTDMTMKILEAIYSDGSPERLAAVINRNISRTDGRQRNTELQAFPHFEWKIPKTNDRLSIEIGVKYNEGKQKTWNDRTINYGADPVPAYRQRQYTDLSPNYTLTQINNISYDSHLSNNFYCSLNYEYRILKRERDSYMYALDRLEDMGVFGTLPAGYLNTLDPANSYTSKLIENTHSIEPTLRYYNFTQNTELVVRFAPSFSLKHTHFDYWRNNRTYFVKHDDFLVKSSKGRTSIEYRAGRSENHSRNFSHILTLNYNIESKTPSPEDMIDIVNDADPLNISEGNPDLRVQYEQKIDASWRFTPSSLAGKSLMNNLCVIYTFTSNALTRGYTYDTTTGVRRFRTYNVDGNSSFVLDDELSLQFGRRKQLTLSYEGSFNHAGYADMIGINRSVPTLSRVYSNNVTQRLKLGWDIGKQNISIGGQFTNRHTTSAREDFNVIDARHFNYGIMGQFRLPCNFGINTDLMCYTRRGYGSKELDTNDVIWNLRLTYSPHKQWVFMVDGFDMLHQLSNVNYAVNATGRTVTYSNALPRYILFSAQYRLSIQPKKKK